LGGDPVTRDPFAVLLAEYEDALTALTRLESAAEGLEADPASEPDRRAVRAILDVLRGAVRDHNEREERALFPLIVDQLPTGVFEEGHRALWTLEEELGRLLDGPGDDPRVASVAREIVDRLRRHIQRENEVLFPMAREALGPGGVQHLAASGRSPLAREQLIHYIAHAVAQPAADEWGDRGIVTVIMIMMNFRAQGRLGRLRGRPTRTRRE